MLLTITDEDGNIRLSLDLDPEGKLFDYEGIITDTGVDVLSDIAGAADLYTAEAADESAE